MKLIIFNGSPRGVSSNSILLAQQFIKGFNTVLTDEVPVYNLARLQEREIHLRAFSEADIVIFIFPLYTDCMPGIVKDFFEHLYQTGCHNEKSLGFIVQSGFMESLHSVFIARYLEKFTFRMKCRFIGIVIKGGVEGIKIKHPLMTKQLFREFFELGVYFAKTSNFSEKLVRKMAKPYRLSKIQIFFFRLLSLTGITNFYWNMHLKKYGVFENRFDTPYMS